MGLFICFGPITISILILGYLNIPSISGEIRTTGPKVPKYYPSSSIFYPSPWLSPNKTVFSCPEHARPNGTICPGECLRRICSL